jgi:membrane protein
MYLRRLYDVLKKAGTAWLDDHAQSMGAALSYYTVFSIAPLLLIAISVAGLVFGQAAARGAVVEQLQGLIGQSGAEAIQGLLRNVSKPAEGVVATITGVVVLIIGATSVFAELQDDLNRIWQAPAKEKIAGWWSWLRTRILSMGMILAIGFLMLVSLAATAAFDAFASWSTSAIGGWETAVHALNFIVSLALTTALFALIYRYMPQATIEWRDVGIGAVVTALLFSFGKYLIGLYIGKTALASGFGAAGSLAVLLAWVYYSAQIFLFGAEFTWAYAHAFGSRQGVAVDVEGGGVAPGNAVPLATTPSSPAVRFR